MASSEIEKVNNMVAKAAKTNRTPTINVIIHLKRSKEEIQFAEKESAKLYELIQAGKETNWATTRIERLHEMIFMPSTETIKNELIDKLDSEDDEQPKEPANT